MITVSGMRWLPLLLLTACTSNDDVVGPYTGPVHRFAVSAFVLPMTHTQSRELAADLDGDNQPDNQLGSAISTLTTFGNVTSHGDDMIASGAIVSVVEIQADSLTDDPTVGVRYLGREGDPVIDVGGEIVDGIFRSNRTATTRAPGLATLRLPVFADADPSVVTLDGLEMDFGPREGGLYLLMRGGVGPEVFDETARGMIQMIDANPQAHPDAIFFYDANRDGTVTTDEVKQAELTVSLLTPDVRIRADGDTYVDRLSFGFGVHLIPCENGNCAAGTPEHTCFDRILDGDESDVDCGGSCRECPAQAACSAPADCQSQSCSGSGAQAGTCAAASCSDGVRDGYETDVDCGWNCAGCANGMQCNRDTDCASMHCGPAGTCVVSLPADASAPPSAR